MRNRIFFAVISVVSVIHLIAASPCFSAGEFVLKGTSSGIKKSYVLTEAEKTSRNDKVIDLVKAGGAISAALIPVTGGISVGAFAGILAIAGAVYGVHQLYNHYNHKDVLILSSQEVSNLASGTEREFRDLRHQKAESIAKEACSQYGLDYRNVISSDKYGDIKALASVSDASPTVFKQDESGSPHWVIQKINCVEPQSTGQKVTAPSEAISEDQSLGKSIAEAKTTSTQDESPETSSEIAQ